jgi:prophage regulatory protein
MSNHHIRSTEVFFLRLPQVQARVSLGKSAIYAAIKAGTFPAPRKLGLRAVAWDSVAIDGWIAQRLTTSPQRAA